MNRRGFLTSLIGGVLAAGVAPNILAGAGRKWVKAKSGLYMINPDWVEAPFELLFCFDPIYTQWMKSQGMTYDQWDIKTLKTPSGEWQDLAMVNTPYPRRFLDANMEHEVPPFKYA